MVPPFLGERELYVIAFAAGKAFPSPLGLDGSKSWLLKSCGLAFGSQFLVRKTKNRSIFLPSAVPITRNNLQIMLFSPPLLKDTLLCESPSLPSFPPTAVGRKAGFTSKCTFKHEDTALLTARSSWGAFARYLFGGVLSYWERFRSKAGPRLQLLCFYLQQMIWAVFLLSSYPHWCPEPQLLWPVCIFRPRNGIMASKPLPKQLLSETVFLHLEGSARMHP